MMAALGIALDLLVLVCLGVTIYYANKLSKSLNMFRQTRQEFGGIMRELSKNIDDAQDAVANLKRASQSSGKDLQKIMNDSKVMASELEIVIQSGAKLAAKLDGLSDKKKRFAQESQDTAAEGFFEESPRSAPAPAKQSVSDAPPSFFIQDREFGEEEEMPEEFQSQAERDLFLALQKERKPSGRRMV